MGHDSLCVRCRNRESLPGKEVCRRCWLKRRNSRWSEKRGLALIAGEVASKTAFRRAKRELER